MSSTSESGDYPATRRQRLTRRQQQALRQQSAQDYQSRTDSKKPVSNLTETSIQPVSGQPGDISSSDRRSTLSRQISRRSQRDEVSAQNRSGLLRSLLGAKAPRPLADDASGRKINLPQMRDESRAGTDASYLSGRSLPRKGSQDQLSPPRRDSERMQSLDRFRSSNALSPNSQQRSRHRSTPLQIVDRQNTVGPMRSRQAKPLNSTEQSSSRQRAKSGQRQVQAPGIMLYMLRLLILGVGVGAIAGTILSVWDPSTRYTAGAAQTAADQVSAHQQRLNRSSVLTNVVSSPRAVLRLTQEMTPLKTEVQALVSQNPGLIPGVMIVDLDTGAFLNLSGTSTFPSASMIKVPILVAFFQDVDAGKIRLDEQLTMQPDQIADGSGEMQFRQPGTRYSALETATKMITISDNTATNMLITRLGGAEVLNQRFQAWGLTTTVIRNPLPDLQGTNTTSPKDLVNLMAMMSQGDLLSLRSRDRLLDIMRRTVTDTLLPSGLGEGAIIAHKTGDIGSLVGDVGLIDVPNGKRYIAAVVVQRPHNDTRAQELIRQISRLSYQYLNPLPVSQVLESEPLKEPIQPD